MQDITGALRDVANNCLGFAMRRSSRAVTNYFNDLLRPLELNVAQFGLLVAIAMDPNKSLAALAEALFLDETTLTRNLAVLERRGLVASDGGRGRGGKRVTVTDAGESILRCSLDVWRTCNTHLSSGLSPEELAAGRTFLKALERAATVARAP